MTPDISLGQSVKQAVRFLQGIHRDVNSMIASLDDEMSQKDWHPTEQNRVTSDLSNGLNGNKWLIKSLYRIYSPHQEATSTQLIVAIQVEFDPPEPHYDEPVCLLFAACFPSPVEYTDIWSKWDHAGSERVLRHLAKKDKAQKLELKLLHDRFMPGATAGAALAVPLCNLTGVDSLRKNVVQPLLEMASGMPK